MRLAVLRILAGGCPNTVRDIRPFRRGYLDTSNRRDRNQAQGNADALSHSALIEAMPDGLYLVIGQGAVAWRFLASGLVHANQWGRLYNVPVYAPFEDLSE